MAEWAKATAGPRVQEEIPSALQEALLDRTDWGFEYDAARTFTAPEAFAARRGNCISYTNLFVALGRSLGVPLRVALLSRRPSSGREGDLVVVYNHVVAVRARGPTSTVYDFGNSQEGAIQRVVLLDDLSVAALAASNRGIEAFRRGDLAAACADLEAAVRLGPGLGLLYANLGLVRVRMGDAAGGLSAYRKGLEISPHNSSILQNLAVYYESVDRPAEARAALKALDAGTASPHGLLVLGNLALSEKNVSAALRYFREASRLAPASVDPLVAIAVAERSRGRESAARKALDKALKLDPDDPRLRALALAPPPERGIASGADGNREPARPR